MNLKVGRRRNDRIVAWDQEWIIFQAQRIDTVKRRLLAAAAAHHADRHELGQFGERAQQGYAAIEMRAGAELDILVAVLHPVHDRHVSGNAEVAGDVEHPQPAPRIGKLGLQIPDIGIVELLEVELGTLQPVVPPDGVGIALDQFEEALNDGFLAGVAGRATVGVRMEAAIKEVEQTGRKIFETLVAQRPDRRPLGPHRGIERLRNRM